MKWPSLYRKTNNYHLTMYYVIFVLLFVSPYISMLMLGLEKGSMIENSDNGTDLNGVDGDDNGDGDDDGVACW